MLLATYHIDVVVMFYVFTIIILVCFGVKKMERLLVRLEGGILFGIYNLD